MKKFEYHVIDTLGFPFEGVKNIEADLNSLGQLGWELVTVVNERFEVFKRTLNEETNKNAITLHDIIGDATDLDLEEKESTY